MSAPRHTWPTSLFAWVDARNGVAGDMLLGAIVDAGASLNAIQHAVDTVLPETVRITSEQVTRGGLRACKVNVSVLIADLPHRDWTTIRSMLQSAALKPAVKDRALAVFGALAQAEARAHGIAVETVHFHEVGSWDSIADVVGVCAGLADLGPEHVLAGPVGVGSGSIRTAHGKIPVPVPAVLELAKGWTILSGGSGELATPTGMALVATLAEPASTLPECRVLQVGVGAGSRDDPGRPNVVRLVLAEPTNASDPGAGGRRRDEACVLAANVDDIDPRLWPDVLTALLDAGADDAWLSPILMKKGRPAHTLQVLCAEAAVVALRERIFELVPTLGVREAPTTKHVMDRVWVEVQVRGQPVRIKLGHRDGRIVTATPEFADIADAALANDSTQRTLLQEANAAAAAAGLVSGAEVSNRGS